MAPQKLDRRRRWPDYLLIISLLALTIGQLLRGVLRPCTSILGFGAGDCSLPRIDLSRLPEEVSILILILSTVLYLVVAFWDILFGALLVIALAAKIIFNKSKAGVS